MSTNLATTKMSSKGQVVIPEAIRKRLGLENGSQFVVLGENDTVILKTIATPSKKELSGLLAKARKAAKAAGLKQKDVTDAIAKAQDETRRQNLSNLNFMVLDAASLPDHLELKESFEYVMAFDAIHDQTRPQDVLRGIYHMLVADGLFSMVDIAAQSNLADNLGHPMGPFLYTVSLMHCMPVGLVNGGAGLGMMWGREKAEEMLKEAGFQKVQVLEIPDDPFNFHFLSRK